MLFLRGNIAASARHSRFPRAACGVGRRGTGRQLQQCRKGRGEILLAVARIAQGYDSPSRATTTPSRRLRGARIAADPVRVFQRLRIVARPLRRLGQNIPVLRGEQRRSDVHLLQLRSGAEVRVNFVGKIVARIAAQSFAHSRA